MDPQHKLHVSELLVEDIHRIANEQNVTPGEVVNYLLDAAIAKYKADGKFPAREEFLARHADAEE